jgi:DNA-binding transcriptional MocR family regulator
MPAQLVSIEVAPDLVDQVYRALLGAISSGTLAPGERITQEDIAQRLSVSRQPVLQALRLLKKDGFVLDAPGRGVLVAPLEAEAMRKVYQVRGALDVLAARLAAQTTAQQGFRIDPELLERGRPQGGARPQRAGHARRRPGLPPRHLRRLRQPPHRARAPHPHWRHLRRAMGAVLQAERDSARRSGTSTRPSHAAMAAGDAERAAQPHATNTASQRQPRHLARAPSRQRLARAASR